MLSISTVARVNINTLSSGVAPSTFDTGALLVPISAAESPTPQFYNNADDAINALLDVGVASDAPAIAAVTKYFAASPAPQQLLLYCYTQALTPSAALHALQNVTDEFYGVLFGTDVTLAQWATIELALRTQEKPVMIFVPITGTVSTATASGSILKTLYDSGSKRFFPFYGSLADTAAVMGTAMGLEYSHRKGVFALCYKTVYGIADSSLTETEVNSLKTLACNVYVRRGGSHLLLENGTVTSGARYDEILALDKIAADLQSTAVALIADNPDKLPQTDDSTAQFINRFSGILATYTDRGVLASGLWRGEDTGPLVYGDPVENGYVLWADSFDQQSDTDRAAHKAMPVHVGLVLSGSIESIVITINVVI